MRTGGDEPFALHCRTLVNAAGLQAQRLARSLEGFPATCVPPAVYAKGHYFTLGGRSPFKHLVYPMPDHAGLGIHVTLDLGGQCKFGPDVSGWPAVPDYELDDVVDGTVTDLSDNLAARYRRAGQPVRHRVAGADLVAGNR